MKLSTDENLEHFRLHGYIVVPDFLTADEVKSGMEEILLYMPSWEEFATAPDKYRLLVANGTSAGSARSSFPFRGRALNGVSTHPAVAEFVRALTGCHRVSLEHSGITGKYAGIQDYDQSLHVDYGNHTLAYPQNPDDDPLFYDFGALVYYSDVSIDLGPTFVVSHSVTAGEQLVPRHRSREEYGWMYEAEEAVTVPAGALLLYSLRTFHRGSAFRAAEGARFSQHLGYRPAPEPYFDPRAFMRAGGSKEMDAFLIAASPEARAMVGFPPVGDPYWTDEMLAGVAARYPEMDMSPYRGERGE